MNGRKLTRLHFPEANFSRVVPGPLENSPKGAFKRSTVLVWFAKTLRATYKEISFSLA